MALDELDLDLDNGGTIHETPGGRKETEHGIIHNLRATNRVFILGESLDLFHEILME